MRPRLRPITQAPRTGLAGLGAVSCGTPAVGGRSPLRTPSLPKLKPESARSAATDGPTPPKLAGPGPTLPENPSSHGANMKKSASMSPARSGGNTVRSGSRAETRAIASKLEAAGRPYQVVRGGRVVDKWSPVSDGGKGVPVHGARGAGHHGGNSRRTAVAAAVASGGGRTFSQANTRDLDTVFNTAYADQAGYMLDEFIDPWGNPHFEPRGLSREMPEFMSAIEAAVYAPDYWRDMARGFRDEFPVLTYGAAAVGGAAAVSIGAGAVRNVSDATRAVNRIRGGAPAFTRSRFQPRGGDLPIFMRHNPLTME